MVASVREENMRKLRGKSIGMRPLARRRWSVPGAASLIHTAEPPVVYTTASWLYHLHHIRPH